MKWFAAVLGLALILLQYRLWLSEDGVRGVMQMQAVVAAQREQNSTLAERNLQQAAEVRDLKQGYSALEERARSDLGMVGAGESFYQVVPGKTRSLDATPVPAAPPIRTAAR
jgi:cell division protein FtsB